MEDKKVYNIGRYRVELILPFNINGMWSPNNNINVYDENGQFLWNISKLLKDLSDKEGFRYLEEMYFDIRVLDNERIFCIGFCNHCEIDLYSGNIIKIVNNR